MNIILGLVAFVFIIAVSLGLCYVGTASLIMIGYLWGGVTAGNINYISMAVFFGVGAVIGFGGLFLFLRAVFRRLSQPPEKKKNDES